MSKSYSWRCATIAVALALGISGPCLANGKIDACKLISAKRASAILGSRLSRKAIHSGATDPNTGSMCDYSNGSTHDGFMLIAGLVPYSNAWEEVARQEKVALSSLPPFVPKPHFRKVTGIGDAAYLSLTSGYFQLHVLSHGSAVAINRNMKANSRSIAQAKKLARVALGHL